MSLASRLSAFFLALLAVVLLGFSATLYGLAAEHLDRQVDDRLDAAIATLAAAAEVGPHEVEWEPDERELGLGRDDGADQVRWVVQDHRGRVRDRSANFNSRRLVPESRPSAGRFQGRDGRFWRVSVKTLNPSPTATDRADAGDNAHRSAALTLIVYAPLGPTEAMLQRLALTLIVLSVSLWLLAAVAGRRLCRRALSPLSRMATAARSARVIDTEARLPLPGTADELEDVGLAFNGLLDRLHEALERQRRFTGDASHQLRTPLAGLLSQVDVALRRERPPAEYQRVLSVIRIQAAQLRQIIESLLFLARAESESGRPELQRLDLARWADEHLQAWAGHPRAGDLRAVVNPADPHWIRAHPSLLAQLVDNLLENACKYSAPATSIVLRVERRAGTILLSVEDQGCGLSLEEQTRIFQPFYRTADARSGTQAGVGLGLAVAERIAAVFGGKIRVESKPGAGSRFTVELPEATAEQETEIAPPVSVADPTPA